MRLGRYLKIFITLFTLNFGAVHSVRAEDIKDTIIDVLSGLTCETQGIGDLLRSEFSHTCIPAPFFTFLVANIVAPLTYANTLLRLKINDDELFPGNCDRSNRANPDDPRISFALCSNIKLAAVRVESVAMSVIAIAKAMITGEDPWNDIKNAWTIDKIKYHNKFDNKAEGDTDVMFDLGIPPVIPWKVIKEKDRICVATTTITFDWIPVGCKYIREPYPKSIYSEFMDLGGTTDTTTASDPRSLTKCNASEGCYQRAYDNSKTGIVISSPLIECVREMTARLLVSRDVCSFDDINAVVGSISRDSSVLFQFQKNMHRAVTAFLTLYVIFFGFKLVLTGDVPPTGELTTFVFKIIFVTYFAVGINITPYSSNDYDRLDGMVQWAFPFLLGGIHQIANWVMSASPSDLCKFNPADYPDGLQHISLWDSLDCRISHYLGLDMLKTMLVENQSRDHHWESFDFFNFSVPPYYYLLIPAVLSGNMTLVSLALMYPLLVISVGAYVINATVICMIAIVILGVLAPLFVPMLLFNYTKGFFEAWVKLMISFLLQPMVAVTFIITMFSIYDAGFYGKCRYTSAEVRSGDRHTKIFYIDNDWATYPLDVSNDIDDAKDCKNSLGFMLNNPVAALYDFSKEAVGDIVKPKNKTEEYMAQFAFLGALSMSPALFFISPKLAFEKIRDLILALITACFTLYLMYNFSAQLSEFAADMTEGVSLSAVTINPQTLFKAGMKVLGAAAGAASKAGAAMGGRKGLEGAADKLSSGGGEADDKISTGDTGAEDKISTGGAARPGWKKAEVSSEAQAKAQATGGSKIPMGAHREQTKIDIPTPISTPSIQGLYVPMGKLDTAKVSDNLSSFFSERNIDANSLKSYSSGEFSRYVAFSSDEKRFEKVKGTYETMLNQTFSDNVSMKGHEADFVNRVEGMFSGTQLQQIKAINDRVLSKAGVPRKLLPQAPASAQDIPLQANENKKETEAPLKKIELTWKDGKKEGEAIPTSKTKQDGDSEKK